MATELMRADDPRNNVGRGAVGRLLASGVNAIKSWGRGAQPELAGTDSGVFNISLPTVTRNTGGEGVYGTPDAPTPVLTPLPSHSGVSAFKATAPAATNSLPSNKTGGVKRGGSGRVISQPDEEGMRGWVQRADGSWGPSTATSTTSVSDTAPAGDRIFSMQTGAGSEAALRSTSIPGNGGYAVQDGMTYVLPQRGASEEAAYKAASSSPVGGVAALATAPAPVDMSPGSQGEWAAKQLTKNRIAALSPDLKNMSISDLVAYKQGIKALDVTSGARYRDTMSDLAPQELGIKAFAAQSADQERKDTATYRQGELGIRKDANRITEAGQRLDADTKIKVASMRTEQLVQAAEQRGANAAELLKIRMEGATELARLKAELAPAKESTLQKEIDKAKVEKAVADAPIAGTDVETALAAGTLGLRPVKSVDRSIINPKRWFGEGNRPAGFVDAQGAYVAPSDVSAVKKKVVATRTVNGKKEVKYADGTTGIAP